MKQPDMFLDLLVIKVQKARVAPSGLHTVAMIGRDGVSVSNKKQHWGKALKQYEDLLSMDRHLRLNNQFFISEV